MGGQLAALIVYIIVVIVIFLILREFWCWYWKINKRVALMEEIVRLLKRADADQSINQLNQNSGASITGDVLTPLIAADSTAAKKQPDISASNVFTIEKGDSVKLLKTENDADGVQWCLVRSATGYEGWCPSKYLRKF
jgi:hypothetical protein